MREILFKAKRLDNGEWVEGSLISTEDNSGFILQSKTKAFIPKRANTFCSTECYEIDQTTLCQYTGLVDKNGKRIWENDIVNRTDLHVVSEPSIGFIEYDLENTSFLIHWTNKVEYSPTYHWKDKLQVIGNIFDNAELLEVE